MFQDALVLALLALLIARGAALSLLDSAIRAIDAAEILLFRRGVIRS